MAYFLLLFRLNNPLLSHESRLQPKVNPSSVSGNHIMSHSRRKNNSSNNLIIFEEKGKGQELILKLNVILNI